MNPLLARMEENYHTVTRHWDDRMNIDTDADDAPAQRLSRARVLVIAGGNLAAHTVQSLAQLPLAYLSVIPLRPSDTKPLQQVAQMPHQTEQLSVSEYTFNFTGFSIMIEKYHLVLVVTDRPYPDLLEEVNKTCVTGRRSWLHATCWGSQLSLGPFVVPGISACYEAYQRRKLANSDNSDVDEAIDYYLRRDKHFSFQGQSPLFNRMFAARIVAEVHHVLERDIVPHTLSRVVNYDPMFNLKSASDVIPALEWCPVCGDVQAIFRDADEDRQFETVIQQSVNRREE